jgi:hypothetical protein
MTVVTDLSPASGARDYRAQLLTIKGLLEDGVEVRSLPRMHAKVLLTDEALVTLGSQNFTSYARRSRECTAVPGEVLNGGEFIAVLREWIGESEPVEEELVNALLTGLDELSKAAASAHAALEDAFSEICRAKEEEEARRAKEQEEARTARQQEEARRWAVAQRQRLEHLQRTSRLRLANEYVFASLVHAGQWAEYKSLIVDSGYDLTLWKRGERTLQLDRLRFIPALLTESGRMGFARLAKTRITYIRQAVKWDSRPLELDGFGPTRLTVRFPKAVAEDGNVHFAFQRLGLTCGVHALFTGEALRILSVTPSAQKDPASRASQFVESCRAQVESQPFFATYMQQFNFSELGLHNQNIESFLDGWRYRIGLIEFADTPVMVLTKIS